ncbi:MAG: hypothetical protein LBC75_12700 [Fibromonadaceae bacterium]|jgi:hypothetical protein|nr:hypothetical protein [Fibromonadaceae bacterium]
MENITKIVKLALVAMLVIFCFACEEKKVAPMRSAAETEWGIGKTNGDYSTRPTRLVVTKSHSNSSKEFTRAVYQEKILRIKYIGEKETAREPEEMEKNFPNYETTKGSEYEIIHFDTTGCGGSCGNHFFFLYNDSIKWGGVPDNIIYFPYEHERPTAYKADLEAMEKQQNGRKIIHSEVIANFDIGGEPNSLTLMLYENTDNGLFQIVLRDQNYDYFTADYPSQLFDGKASWQTGVNDDPGYWNLQFVGRVAEGLFLVTEWGKNEGNDLQVFVAENGKLKLSN